MKTINNKEERVEVMALFGYEMTPCQPLTFKRRGAKDEVEVTLSIGGNSAQSGALGKDASTLARTVGAGHNLPAGKSPFLSKYKLLIIFVFPFKLKRVALRYEPLIITIFGNSIYSIIYQIVIIATVNTVLHLEILDHIRF